MLRDDCQVYYILATFVAKLKQNSIEIIGCTPVDLCLTAWKRKFNAGALFPKRRILGALNQGYV